jgi:hypothetical protein
MPALDKKLSRAVKHLQRREINSKEYMEPPPKPSKLSNSLQVIIGETFAPETHNDYLKVAQDVLGIIQTLIPGELPAGYMPLNLDTWDIGYPKTIVKKDKYQIYLSIKAEKRPYNQFAYQLGHELGHVMLDPRRSNGMDETLATLISYEVLDQLAKKWVISPPYSNWKDYAVAFTDYRIEDEYEHLNHFDPEVQEMVKSENWQALSAFMKDYIEEQDTNFTSERNRDLNWLGTLLLRTLPIPWMALQGLAGLTDPSADQEPGYREKLQIVLSKVPPEVLPLFQILGRD